MHFTPSEIRGISHNIQISDSLIQIMNAFFNEAQMNSAVWLLKGKLRSCHIPSIQSIIKIKYFIFLHNLLMKTILKMHFDSSDASYKLVPFQKWRQFIPNYKLWHNPNYKLWHKSHNLWHSHRVYKFQSFGNLHNDYSLICKTNFHRLLGKWKSLKHLAWLSNLGTYLAAAVSVRAVSQVICQCHCERL
jgi:hypothetical protein